MHDGQRRHEVGFALGDVVRLTAADLDAMERRGFHAAAAVLRRRLAARDAQGDRGDALGD